MYAVGTYHAKTHLTDLLARVEAGEEVVITRHGRPVARLVPMRETGSAPVDDVVEEFRKLRQSVSSRGGMKGVSVRDLIHEGRRV
jgi:prevent-host-death family protein